MSTPIPAGLPVFRPSGRVSFVGLLVGAAAAVAGATFLAPVYAYGVIYVPIAQISVVLTAAYGAMVGGITAGIMQRFHVRNRWVIIASALTFCGYAWFVQWFPWLYGTLTRFEVEFSGLDLLNPFFLASALSTIYEEGTWTLGHSSSSGAVSGLFLGFIWVLEFLTLVGTGVGIAWTMTADKVFCERCTSWCKVAPRLRAIDVVEGRGLREALRDRGDVEALAKAANTTSADNFVLVKAAWCGCGETNVVALDEVRVSTDSKGRRTENLTSLLPFHLVPQLEMDRLRGGS